MGDKPSGRCSYKKSEALGGSENSFAFLAHISQSYCGEVLLVLEMLLSSVSCAVCKLKFTVTVYGLACGSM